MEIRQGVLRDGQGEGEKRRGAGTRRRRTSPELKLKSVKLYLEWGLPSRLICQEFRIRKHALYRWARQYRQLNSEVEPDTYSRKEMELWDRLARLKLQIDACDRQADEMGELAIKVSELS